jgi:UTP--glucose-1-phosphate uridylyltransferase
LLKQLLARQIRYAFIANADNLGATLDTTILGYLVHHNLPFLMEVADRTPADRKGGHLARRREDGQLLLREAAQTTPLDQAAFQDIERYRYFNTNSIWIDLQALQALLHETQGILPLPLIRNAKTLDPRDPASTPVYQLETAMGSAIAIFQGAQALRVSRRRFAPVKTTDDLLAIRSDAYLRHPDGTLSLNPERQGIPPLVKLDPRFYKLIDQLDQRFPYGSPSLLRCKSLTVQGDITFGKDILCLDHTTLHAPQNQATHIPDHTTLQGEREFSPS